MITYGDYFNAPEPGVLQFENANEGRSYPFMDNTILKAKDGSMLSDSVVADLHLVVPKGKNACLSSVYISKNMVSLCIKVIGASASDINALSCSVKSDSLEPYTPYRLEKLTGSEDVGGIVTFGVIDFEAMQGSYRFNDMDVPLAESVISRYTPAKLRKFIDPRSGKILSGDVDLEFSNHIEVTKKSEGIKLNLSEGSHKILMSKCETDETDDVCGATPVTRINGVASDSERRIVLWFH